MPPYSDPGVNVYKTNLKFLPKVACVLIFGAILSACGGGGSGSSESPAATASEAEGVYGGTITGGASPEFQLLLLPDGQYWSMYGRTTGGQFLVSGFIQGTGTTSNGTFTSSDAKDFGLFPATSGTISATYNTTAQTISGTSTSAGGSATFSGGPIAGSLYNYKTTANLNSIAGNWSGSNTGGENVDLTVSAAGAVTATTSGGCNATGTATPRPDARNVFTVALLQGNGCALQGQTIRGIVLVYPLASGRTQLVGAVIDDARTAGIAVFANR